MVNLVIIGTGALAEETFWIAQEESKSNPTIKLRVVGFLGESNTTVKELCGIPVITDQKSMHKLESTHFVCAIGDNATRSKVVAELESTGFSPRTVMHPTVLLGHNVTVGIGCIIAPYVVFGPHSKLGNHSIVNTGASIGHHSNLGTYVNLCPGARLGGETTVGDRVFFGTNAVIHPGVKIGDDSSIGAGSFVVRSVSHHQTVYGNPAKVLR